MTANPLDVTATIAAPFGEVPGEAFARFVVLDLFFGLALVLMMVLRPRGLVSGRTPSVALTRDASQWARASAKAP